MNVRLRLGIGVIIWMLAQSFGNWNHRYPWILLPTCWKTRALSTPSIKHSVGAVWPWCLLPFHQTPVIFELLRPQCWSLLDGESSSGRASHQNVESVMEKLTTWPRTSAPLLLYLPYLCFCSTVCAHPTVYSSLHITANMVVNVVSVIGAIGESHRCICLDFCARAAIPPDTRSHFSLLLLGPFRLFKARIASLDNSLRDNQLRSLAGIDLREWQVHSSRIMVNAGMFALPPLGDVLYFLLLFVLQMESTRNKLSFHVSLISRGVCFTLLCSFSEFWHNG
jgi:hypothetical protein